MGLYNLVREENLQEVEVVTTKSITLENLSKEEILELIFNYRLTDLKGKDLKGKYENLICKEIIVKCFSYEENLKYYSLLEEKKDAIKKAEEVLNALFGDVKITYTKGRVFEKNALDIREEQLVKKVVKQCTVEQVLIEDLLTIVYLGEAFLLGNELSHTYVVLSGNLIKEALLLKVNKGASIKEIAEKLSINIEDANTIVLGGIFTGTPKFDLDGQVSSITRGILISKEKEDVVTPCIRCSKCIRICPEGLNPIKLMELWERGEKEEFLRYGGNKCISCGLCSYVCPCKIQVSGKIQTGKVFVNKG